MRSLPLLARPAHLDRLARRAAPPPARIAALLAVLAAACGCDQGRVAPLPETTIRADAPAAAARGASAQPAQPSRPVALATQAPAGAPVAAAPAGASAAAAPRGVSTAAYPWLGDASLSVPAPVDALEDRFAPPPGFTRAEVAAGSFGAWLRRLPLAAAGTPVLSHRGGVILPPDHDNLAAVVAIDTGAADLQHCADAILRLHAEWRWSRGEREMSYRAGAGVELPFSRWLAGERPVLRGDALVWERKTRAGEADHPTFRRWLDGVFTWANTGSLSLQARPVERADLAPGDFVVQPGGPGHAVLVLDLARAPAPAPGGDGRVALLLGQSFMPAQNVQVLRPSAEATWFVVAPGDEALRTPFWRPFPWRMLRRLPG